MNLENRKQETGNNEKIKVALGLSGGVDSAVCAALLLEQGYEVTGVYLECWNEPGCRTDQDRKDALDVALKLGIPYKVLDFKKEYIEKVVEYFYREYEAGRTPNPDTMCNREIKFGMFYRWALRHDSTSSPQGAQGKLARYDYVATGHYAGVQKADEIPYRLARHSRQAVRDDKPGMKSLPDLSISDEKGRYVLQRGMDPKKDQSYFLYQLRPEQLEHILFPIGGMTKEEVRKIAEERKLPVAKKPDSQGICFIGNVDVRGLLKKRIKTKKGKLVVSVKNRGARIFGNTNKTLKQVGDGDVKVVGHHEGVWFYTVGQRLGKELDQAKIARLCKAGILSWDPQNLPPLYVVEKDVENNILKLGVEVDLKRDTFRVDQVNKLVAEEEFDELVRDCYVRIRHGGKLVRASLAAECSGGYVVELDGEVKGVAEGQAAVFYSCEKVDAVVLGGGVIL